MDTLIEQWKLVAGYEKTCAISDHGRFKTLNRIVHDSSGRDRYWPELVLKPRLTSNGYPFISLGQGVARKGCMVHRLVARAFVENPLQKPHVNHKDGNKQNNHFSNLEWVTCAENLEHARNVLLAYSKRELTRFEVAEICARASEKSEDLAKDFGVDRGTIYKVWTRNEVTRVHRKRRMPRRDASTGQFVL